MEVDLIFLKMEGDLNFFENGRLRNFFEIGILAQFVLKMEDNLIFYKSKTTFIYKLQTI